MSYSVASPNPFTYQVLNADTTNNTAAMATLNFSVNVTAGVPYTIDACLLASDSTAADGIQVDFNGGTATITYFLVNAALLSDSTGAAIALAAGTSTSLAGVLNASAMGTTNVHMMLLQGHIIPATTGTLRIRAAQNAHTTGTLTVKRGSYIRVDQAVVV